MLVLNQTILTPRLVCLICTANAQFTSSDWWPEAATLRSPAEVVAKLPIF